MNAAVTQIDADAYCWTSVCPLTDMIDNVGQCALVNGKQIALFYLSEDKQLFAIDNYDPFSHANVLSRGVVGDIKGRLVVASPIYKQHFDLATGQCIEEASIKLQCYPVRVLDGVIQIAGGN